MMGSLAEFIEVNQCGCDGQLERPGQGVSNLFTADESFVVSDTDPELLIKVKFRSPVKLASVKIIADAAEDEELEASAPRDVKVFQNRPDMGFSDAADEAAPCELTFEENDYGSANDQGLKTPFVKFQNVHSLQIYVQSNIQDTARSKIKQICLFGQPAANMDMAAWKPVKG